jgi:hypothetical protein
MHCESRIAKAEHSLVLGTFINDGSRDHALRHSDWNDHDFNVLADGVVIGRIFKANAAPVGASWMWTLVFRHHAERT